MENRSPIALNRSPPLRPVNRLVPCREGFLRKMRKRRQCVSPVSNAGKLERERQIRSGVRFEEPVQVNGYVAIDATDNKPVFIIVDDQKDENMYQDDSYRRFVWRRGRN
jgi:hypothetical protein